MRISDWSSDVCSSDLFSSWSRGEDYYNEGSLMWLEADMLIRGATNNAKSLDDFARAFFGGREGDWGQDTYNFDDVVAARNAVHPNEWTTFLHERMRTRGRPAPTRGIESAGYSSAKRSVGKE